MFEIKRLASAVAVAALVGVGTIGSASAVSVSQVTLFGGDASSALSTTGIAALPIDDGDDNPVAPFNTFPINADLGVLSPGGTPGFSVNYNFNPNPSPPPPGIPSFPLAPFNNAFLFSVGAGVPSVGFELGVINPQGSIGFDNLTLRLFDVSGDGLNVGSNIGGLTGAFAALQVTTDESNSAGDQLVSNFVLDQVVPGVTQILGVFSADNVFAPSGPPGTTQNANYNTTISAVPLPAPVVLLISALVGLGFLGRRKARV